MKKEKKDYWYDNLPPNRRIEMEGAIEEAKEKANQKEISIGIIQIKKAWNIFKKLFKKNK